MSQVTDKHYHIMLYLLHLALAGFIHTLYFLYAIHMLVGGIDIFTILRLEFFKCFHNVIFFFIFYDNIYLIFYYFFFYGKFIPLASDHTNLGITFSEKAKWNKHVENLIQSVSKHICVLRKLKYKLNRQILEKLYLIYIRPIFFA
jgi:hypothetical protein